jgi:hypothetical protein
LVVAVALLSAWPLTTVRLERHDHPTHLFKAWQFFNEMLLHGRLSGYNHHWAFGYPVNDITSCGAEMWVALHRILTFGLLSWEHTYRLAIGSVILFTGLSSYAFTRRYFNCFVAAFAGVLSVLDPGASFQGGWEWAYTFGVWPVTLSCCCVLMALAKLEDTLRNAGTRHPVVSGAWIAAALWVHPLSLILFALSLPLVLADFWSRRHVRIFGPFKRVILAYALGFGGSAFSVVPMLARSFYTFDRGAPPDTVEHWAHKLLELRVFDGTLSLLCALGLFGAVRALVTARRGGFLLSAGFALCLFIATDIPFTVFHAERIFPGLVKLESGRMLMGCKLFGFPLIAYGLSALFERSSRLSPWLAWSRPGRLRTLGRWLIVGGLMSPFVPAISKRIYEGYLRKSFATEFSPQSVADYESLITWARQQREREPDFYRIAFSASSLELLETASPMVTRTPIYIDIGTSAQQFGVFPADIDPEMLQALSVKFIVSDHPLYGSSFIEEKTFGGLRVYRFRDYRKERFSISGPGSAEQLAFGPDRIRLRVDGAGPDTRLKLHVAAYERWEATQAGQTLPIQSATVTPQEYPVLMEVPVQSGVVEFRFVRRGVDWLGFGLTLLTVGLVLRYTLLARRWPVRVDALAFIEQRQRTLAGIVLACGLVIVVFCVQRARTRKHLLPSNSLFHQLAGSELTGPAGACQKLGALDFECSQPLSAQYTGGSWGAHLCMSTAERAPLKISTVTDLGSALQVYTDTLADSGSIHVEVNGQDLGTLEVRRSRTDWRVFQFDTRGLSQRNQAKLEITLSGPVLRCFDVRKVPNAVLPQ